METAEEIWKHVFGYEGFYMISNFGRLKSLARKSGNNVNSVDKIKSVRLTARGYLSVNLCKDKRFKSILLHRLVATHFIPNPTNLPEVNHIDGNKLNCCSTNLEWVSRQGNINHAISSGISFGPKQKISDAEQIEIIRLHSNGLAQTKIAKMFNTSHVTVSKILKGIYWKSVT